MITLLFNFLDIIGVTQDFSSLSLNGSDSNPSHLMEIQELIDECYRLADGIARRLPRHTILHEPASLIYKSAIDIGRRAAIDEGLGIGNSSIAVEEYSFSIHLLQFLLPDANSDDQIKIRAAISRFEKIYDARFFDGN